VKSLVIFPIQPEIDGFVQACADQGIQPKPARIGRLAVTRLPDLGLTLAPGGLGKVQFAVQTQHLLDAAPGWDVALCAGTAGALTDGIAVGDVVVGTATVEHDMINRFGKPLLPRFESAPAVVEVFKQVGSGENSFRVHFGPIASGDEDVVDVDRRSAIQHLTGALVVAWEGAGGARACRFSGVPFVELRGVSDSADSAAASDFEIHLKAAMRNLAKVIIAWAGREV
jgi:adenosylhomocysteine nucleosidase